MPSIRLPGGHRITGVPDVRPRDDFTPTFTEYFWASVIPPNPYNILSDKSGEPAMYFAVNMTAATAALAYSHGNNLAALRYMKAGQMLTSPVGVASLAATGWVATADQHGAVTPGVASGIGMPMTPDLYSQGTPSNPAGWDIAEWWANLT